MGDLPLPLAINKRLLPQSSLHEFGLKLKRRSPCCASVLVSQGIPNCRPSSPTALFLLLLPSASSITVVSADERKDAVMRGVTQGACDFLIKPLRIEAIKNIWQHFIRKKRNEIKEMEQSGSVVDGEQHHQILSDDADYASSINNGNWRNSKRRKDDKLEGEDGDDTPTLKMPRVVWILNSINSLLQLRLNWVLKRLFTRKFWS